MRVGLREWAPRAFAAFAAERPLQAIGTRGYPWIEIDFPEDYRRAIREVLPLVENDGLPRPARGFAPVGRLANALAR
jgi:NDP-sugar pyrophosphorylase family protein